MTLQETAIDVINIVWPQRSSQEEDLLTKASSREVEQRTLSSRRYSWPILISPHLTSTCCFSRLRRLYFSNENVVVVVVWLVTYLVFLIFRPCSPDPRHKTISYGWSSYRVIGFSHRRHVTFDLRCSFVDVIFPSCVRSCLATRFSLIDRKFKFLGIVRWSISSDAVRLLNKATSFTIHLGHFSRVTFAHLCTLNCTERYTFFF